MRVTGIMSLVGTQVTRIEVATQSDVSVVSMLNYA